MRLLAHLLALATLLTLPFFSQAQCGSTSLTVGTGPNNSQTGVMFDVTAKNNINITCVDIPFRAAGNTTVSVYYKTGTCVGYQGTSSAWTLLGTVALTSTAANTPVRLILPVAQTLNNGAISAFYFTSPGLNVAYTNGTGAVGDVAASDANLSVKQGYGVNGSFGGLFSPRVFNSAIYYSVITPLPVKLTAFTGQNQGSKNLLQWQTASEANSAYFAVERSADGQAFVGVGTVAAAGTSTQQHSYSFADAAQPGQWYYRLEQVDLDGRHSYSPVVVLERTATLALAYYPNPVQDKLLLVPASGSSFPLRLQLHAASGQVVYEQVVPLADTQPLQVDVASLPTGFYILSVTTATGQTTYRSLQKAP